MLDNTQAVAGITAAVVATCFTIGGLWLKYGLPKWRRTKAQATAAWDSIVGREAVVDSITGKELAPALPGVGVRLDILTDAVTKMSDQHVRIESLELSREKTDAELVAHAAAIQELKAATVERIVTKSESAAAWRAIEAIAHDPDAVEDEGRGTE